MPALKPKPFRSPISEASSRIYVSRRRPASSADAPLLIYCRPLGSFVAEDQRIALLQARLSRPLRVVRATPDEIEGHWDAWVSPVVPSLLVIREGKVVGGAMGCLSARELEDVVHRALA